MDMNILLVEDEKRQYDTFEMVLKELNSKHPLKVHWAQKDEEVLKIAHEKRFDLVFMDIGLRDSQMDGIALTKHLKKELRKDWPIVIFSISRNEEDKEAAMSAGADQYLAKPYGYMEMMISLGDLISKAQRGELA